MEEVNSLTTYGDIVFNFGTEVLPDLAEVAVDELLNEGLLRDIPVVGTFIKTGKLIIDLREAIFTKHVLVFAQQFNNGTLSKEKIKKHFEKLNTHPKKKMQELEVILKSLSNNRKHIQDKILANFYTLYCDPDCEFDWSDFELSGKITEDIFPLDIKELDSIYNAEIYTERNFDEYAMARLSNLGLVVYSNGMKMGSNTSSGYISFIARITELGKFYWENGIKGLKIHHDLDGELRIL